jgi:uncharacterized protein YlxW (UPF0749 family)
MTGGAVVNEHTLSELNSRKVRAAIAKEMDRLREEIKLLRERVAELQAEKEKFEMLARKLERSRSTRRRTQDS